MCVCVCERERERERVREMTVMIMCHLVVKKVLRHETLPRAQHKSHDGHTKPCLSQPTVLPDWSFVQFEKDRNCCPETTV